MAYQGYLIKVGSYEIDPAKYISAESYKAIVEVQDLDPERDLNGELHRNPVSHVPIKVEFNTPAMLTNTELSALFGGIKTNYINELERSANITLYVPEKDDYITQKMYLVQPEPEMYMIDGNKIYYKALRLAFVGY